MRPPSENQAERRRSRHGPRARGHAPGGPGRAALVLAAAAVWLAGCVGTTVQVSGSERGIDRYRVALPF